MSEKDIKRKKSGIRRFLVPPMIFFASLVITWMAANWVIRRFVVPDFQPSIMRTDSGLGWTVAPNVNITKAEYNLIDIKGPVKWDHRKYGVRTDSRGFRGLESEGDESKFRVICLGDSSTFGLGEEEQYIYVNVIATGYKTGKPVRIYNLGVPGYSSLQGLLSYRKWAETLKPNLVTISFGANDYLGLKRRPLHSIKPLLPDSAVFGDAWQPTMGQRLKYDSLNYLIPKFRNSPVFFWMLTKLMKASAPDRPEEQKGGPRVPIPDYKNNLENMILEAGRLKSPAVLISICSSKEYEQAMAEVADKYGIPYVIDKELFQADIKALSSDPVYGPLLELVRGRYPAEVFANNPDMLFTNDHCHPNPLGHRLIGDAAVRGMEMMSGRARVPENFIH